MAEVGVGIRFGYAGGRYHIYWTDDGGETSRSSCGEAGPGLWETEAPEPLVMDADGRGTSNCCRECCERVFSVASRSGSEPEPEPLAAECTCSAQLRRRQVHAVLDPRCPAHGRPRHLKLVD